MAKRGPAIGGLHSQGIVDDVVKGIGKLVGSAKIRKQVKKAYPIVKDTDATVVKQMRKEQLMKAKGYVKSGPKAQQSSRQKGALNKLKMETKPLPPKRKGK